MSGFKKSTAITPTQILFNTEPQVSVGIVVSDSGVTANSEGKKIVKAGTPLTGNLEARSTAFTAGTSNAVGVLLHDVDVTNGAENGTLLIFGFVNLDRLDSTTAALITSEVKTALNAKVTFIK
ncbi:MAG: hypothetical protein MSH60_08815 [Ruminococcus sp.]|nr:hypothetical protein [Ruminococcus sp.]